MTRVCLIRSLVRLISCLRDIWCDEGPAVVEFRIFYLCEFIRNRDSILQKFGPVMMYDAACEKGEVGFSR